jgi:outer membrane protein assembly factor BamB
MHDIEHKSAQEEPASTPEQKDISTAGRQKLPRAWRYALIGGTVLLVFAVIIAGVLSLTNQKAKQPTQTRSAPTTGVTTLPTSTIGATTLPTPASTPIPAPVSSDHNVSVMVAGGVAYLGTTDNAVYALRISNGSLLWRYKIEGSVDAQPLVANGVVYVTSFVGQNGPVYAYALRASDGSLLWRYSGDTYSYLSLSTTDSSLAFVASQGGISALNTSNGTVLWHYNAMKGTDSGFSLEVNGVVYFGASIDNVTGTLYALRASNGTPLWHYTTDGYIDTPTVANGVVYVDSGAGTLAALRASDGHQLWKQTIDATLIQPPQLVNGVVYIAATKFIPPPAARIANPLQGLTDIGALLWNTIQNAPARQTVPQKEGISSIYAVRASDGTILWHFTTNKGGDSWVNWFSVEHGIVYASATDTEGNTGTGDIYALQSNNGSVLWQDTLNASPSGGLLANGVIYLSASNGSDVGAVYTLRARDGSLLWNYPIAGSMFNAPVLDGNVAYVGASNGMAYALRADNGRIVWHYLTQTGG